MIRRRCALFAVCIWLLAAPLAFDAQAQTLVATPNNLFFSYTVGGTLPGPQFVAVSSNATTQLVFSATAGGSAWLSVSPAGGATPQQMQIDVNPIGLDPGTYTDSVVLESTESKHTVRVTLFVAELASGLVATPSILNFQAQVGQISPVPSQVILISSIFNQPTDFIVSVAGGGTWLFVGPRSSTTPNTIEVTVNHTGLSSGTYTALINIEDKFGTIAQSVQLTFTVSGDIPVTAEPSALLYSAEFGSSVPQSQNILVAGVGGRIVDFLASAATFSGGNWLSVNPLQGATNRFLAVTVNASNVPVGNHAGVVRLTALGQTTTVPVTLTVSTGPLIVLSPTELAFVSGNGSVPEPKSVFVDSFAGAPVPFVAISAGGSWLSVTPSSGATFATLRVSVNPQGLAPNVYRGVVSVLAQGSGVPRTLNVTLTVTTESNLVAQPAAVILTAQQGDTAPVTATITITSTLGVLNFNAGVSPVPWLAIRSLSSITPGSVVIEANPGGLAVGEHSATLFVTAFGASNSPMTIPVTLTITRAGPVIASVLHGASLRSSVVAVGTVVSIFGNSLGPEEALGLEIGSDGRVTTNLRGVRVLFDGVPGVLTYAHKIQVNCLVPYGMAGRTFVDVVVEYQGRQSEPVTIQMFVTAPGIFTLEGSGFGPGATLNQDGTVNGANNGAARGSYVSVYATGGGVMDPPGVDGEITGSTLPRPLLPVKAWIGGREAEVSYAGGSTGLLTGVLQINIKVPSDLEPGTHELVIQVGDLVSQLGVTIVVQ